MKALSIRQPWAELILQGRKTIELRTWQTAYRGPIAIHASQKVSQTGCTTYGFDPGNLPRGALVGTARLVEIVALDEAAWEGRRDEHLSPRAFPGSIFGWRLEGVQRLPRPISLAGQLGLFNLPDEAIAADALLQLQSCSERDPEKPFELRVVPGEGSGYGLALYQWPVAANNTPTHPQRLVWLDSSALRAVADHVLEALRQAGYRATDLSRERRDPFLLDEETGLRLSLLFLAVKPLTRVDRIESISGALRVMPSEEAYYWFSKCTAIQGAANAQRALRILLSGE